MKRTVRKFYTLVEIMTVIVIAAILFGIGIPAFTTMIQGSNMTVAIRQLSAKISAARAYAVTNRCKVAVLLARNNVKDENCYSAYRVCVVDDSNTFQEWIEDENWKTLPKGVLVLPISTDYQDLSDDKKPDFKNISVDATDIGGNSTTQASAFIFEKNGQMTNSTSTIWLRQGRYVSSPVYTERNDSGQFISHQLEIVKYSGKVKVKDITETEH